MDTYYIAQEHHMAVEPIYADNLAHAEFLAERDYTYGIVFESEAEAYEYLDDREKYQEY